jgi:alkylation response protein AidB-like acyl-CoA dehydrogenase
MRRTVFSEDHESFRDAVRTFLAKEVVPAFPEWEKAGAVPRELYLKLGELGAIGVMVPEEYGGGGQQSYKFNAALFEEAARAKVGLGALRVHMDIVLPYFLRYADHEQKARWLPGIATGQLMTAIAMTEPGTGSDLAGMTTTAKLDGDHYVLNGAKTFITGGVNADLVVVVARTSPATETDRRGGLTLMVVETDSPGYAVGRALEKLGHKSQDTAELSFTDVRVPTANVLGEIGQAFGYLGHNLPQERLSIAIGALASAHAAVDLAIEYVLERRVFGKPVASFQNTKFVLAECATELEAGQMLLDRALEDHDHGELTPADAAKVKLFTTDVQARVTDKCLQLFGGYGYILEYPIARLYADARVTRIYGGTSEIMKSIIAKSLGL